MTYNPDQPIDTIFNSIDDLVKYTRADEEELTKSKTIKLALIILHRQLIFKDDFRGVETHQSGVQDLGKFQARLPRSSP